MSSKDAPYSSEIRFELPDPARDDLSNIDFQKSVENAWTACESFDLQTDIWRGKILRVIRDREKRGGFQRSSSFLQWLREREISKSRAYSLIQLADSADELVEDGLLKEESVNLFSKRAFLETARSEPEVQQMISEVANKGNEITRRQVRRLKDEFTAVTSHLLPEEIRKKTQENLLPPRFVAPLVKELAKLPIDQQQFLKNALEEEPEVECIKDVTSAARRMSNSLDACISLRAFNSIDVNLEKAMNEAQRLEILGLLSEAFSQAKMIESSVIKMYSSWFKLGSLYERLWEQSGSSTPHLRQVLEIFQSLTGAMIKVSLGELAGGKKIRLQIVEEAADQTYPPSFDKGG